MKPEISRIVFASSNAGKLLEVRQVARQFGVEILSPIEISASPPLYGPLHGKLPSPNENGLTYTDNACIKADSFFAWCGLPALGDDAGLEVQALGNAPGLYSARYAGEGASDVANIEKLLANLKGQTMRTAVFRCVLYLKVGPGQVHTSEGLLEGEILTEMRGAGGFGYDSVFWLPKYGKSLAELKEQNIAVKTHRIQALETLFTQFCRRAS